MRKARTWAACLGVLVFVTLTISSARADSFSAVDLVTLNNNAQDLVFENSSGKHLGFSVATANRGNRTGLFRGPTSSGGGSGEGGGSTIPNPEPTAVLLLGSGLVAAGAYARRRFRKPGR